MKRSIPVAVIVLVLLVSARPSFAQDVKCPPTAARGDTVAIALDLKAFPDAKGPVTVPGSLTPSGTSAAEASPTSLSANIDGGVAKVVIPDLTPLGPQSLKIALSEKSTATCAQLLVTLPAVPELKLFPFDPAGTETTETEYVLPAGSPSGTKPEETATVRLKLRGSGFVVKVQSDNHIEINGTPVPVMWDNTCQDVPAPPNAKTTPRPPEPVAAIVVHGQVLSASDIVLCHVRVPSDDAIHVAVNQDGRQASGTMTFRIYRWSTGIVGTAAAAIALILSLVVLGLVEFTARQQPGSRRHNVIKILFMDQETDTYSLSKFQFYWWTTAAVFGYSYLVISKMLVQGDGLPEIPGSLPGIIAIGATTAVGAQVVTNMRGSKGGGSEEPTLGDLVTSGGVTAPDRVQMLVWTILGVGAFCLAVLQHKPGDIQTLDPIPTGLMQLMGLSATGYLAGKLARKAGPVLNEISIVPSQSDAALATAAAPPPPPPPNVSPSVTQAQAVLQGLAGAPAGNAQAATTALSTAITLMSQIKSLADAQAATPKLAGFVSDAEKAAQALADDSAKPGAPADSTRAAQIGQRAAAALHDLSAALATAVGIATPPAGPLAPPRFTRVIELRGRNMSTDGALIEIDGVGLPFRMLVPNADGKQIPEIVIPEPDDPASARILRLSIDPSQLEPPNFDLYKRWFGKSDTTKKTLTLTNLDGQKSDITFTVP